MIIDIFLSLVKNYINSMISFWYRNMVVVAPQGAWRPLRVQAVDCKVVWFCIFFFQNMISIERILLIEKILSIWKILLIGKNSISRKILWKGRIISIGKTLSIWKILIIEQARKSSEDTHFTEYARFEKVWAQSIFNDFLAK